MLSRRRVFLIACLVLLLIIVARLALHRPDEVKNRAGATPVSLIKVKKGFQVELLHSTLPKTEGSWVSMCVDPKGRLLVSDQFGKLFRVTPPALGQTAGSRVEPIDVDIGEAQGLLWAFNSLYVVVSQSQKYPSGLYRVRASHGDDRLDKLEKLRDFPQSGGEHGPHAVLLGPDGKSLYVLAGNHTPLVTMDSSLVPRLWREDALLPRQFDGEGRSAQITAPAGWIGKTDPDGKKWELVSMGLGNAYDGAFNQGGELFTCDSDVEGDMNTPWYRPTRLCHVVDGSEFGWRSGTGIFPSYYPDDLPSVVDIGPGSPSGMTFGYGARFPAKYQNALFVCDWSYGKLYAVHLQPDGSSYRGEYEEFLNGTPLPLTDIVVSPRDGAVYFITGGRKTMSGLYRLTYAGMEPTAPSKGDATGAEARAERKKLESYYLTKDPQAIDAAWPYLGHADRFLRYAGRTVLEHHDPGTWQERALKETSPHPLLAALLAVVRAGDRKLQPRVLEALAKIDWEKLAEPLKLELIRVYQLAFIRLGEPPPEARVKASARFDAVYPAGRRQLNAELCKLLVYLEAPSAATKTMALLAKAPTQEEQLEYALALRNLRGGWTMELRKAYFSWLGKAAGYRGGYSFAGFVSNIKKDAVALLSEQEQASLKPLLNASPIVEDPWTQAKPRPFVRNWMTDDLLPLLSTGLAGRDYDRGRQLFGECKCYACHCFNGEGSRFGPDLTILSGRFSSRDVIDKVINPSKYVSDPYAALTITTVDGKVITGRIINLSGDNYTVNTNMLDPNSLTKLNRTRIETMVPSKISMMPAGLLDALHQDEILDLLAYLLSRGDRKQQMFPR